MYILLKIYSLQLASYVLSGGKVYIPIVGKNPNRNIRIFLLFFLLFFSFHFLHWQVGVRMCWPFPT